MLTTLIPGSRCAFGPFLGGWKPLKVEGHPGEKCPLIQDLDCLAQGTGILLVLDIGQPEWRLDTTQHKAKQAEESPSCGLPWP